LLLLAPVCGAILAGVLVGVARKLVREPQAPATDFIVLGSIAGVSVVALAFLLVSAARLRHGAHTHSPRLWRIVPWTAAGGFVVGLVVAGVHALTK
jgi:hypothetical protein